MKSFFEIANSKSWYQNMIFWSHRIDYLISRIKVVFFLDQENVFLISENHFFIYQKIELISKSFLYKKKKSFAFSDIRKSIFGYQKKYFSVLNKENYI